MQNRRTPTRSSRRTGRAEIAKPLDARHPAYEIIYRGLKNHHRGPTEPTTKARILEGLARAGHPIHHAILDETIIAMREAGFPICGTSTGMFWATSTDHLLEAKAYVDCRHKALARTSRAYEVMIRRWRAAPTTRPAPAVQGQLFQAPAAGDRS